MRTRFVLWVMAVPLATVALGQNQNDVEMVELQLQTRDLETSEPRYAVEKVDPSHVGVVAVDVWNFHWCKTSAARAGSFVPRMNRALTAARSLGMQVFHCPTDAIEAYIGEPQLEATLAVQPVPLPDNAPVDCPSAPDGGGCTCGRMRCMGNFGWDGLHPDLYVADGDLMPNDSATLYALCRQKGLTHLIYAGFHTQVCLLGKSIGVRNMDASGVAVHAGARPDRRTRPLRA